MDVALPVLFAVFVWWFATGLVMLLDGLPRTTFRWSHLIASLLALGAYVGLVHTAAQTTPAGAFCAFTCALLVWAWHELSFLTGWVTGPRKVPATPGLRGRARFHEAVQAILWHELAIAASGLVIVALTWEAPNLVGTQTFAVLWLMRISAKLNVYLGVRNLSTEILPAHLAYLGSYFRRRAMNPLLPLVVGVGGALTVMLVRQALAAPTGSAAAIGALLVATLLGLAVLEHALLVLPLSPTALWRWALRNHPEAGRAAVLAGTPPSAPGAPVAPVAAAHVHPLPIDPDAKLFHAR